MLLLLLSPTTVAWRLLSRLALDRMVSCLKRTNLALRLLTSRSRRRNLSRKSGRKIGLLLKRKTTCALLRQAILLARSSRTSLCSLIMRLKVTRSRLACVWYRWKKRFVTAFHTLFDRRLSWVLLACGRRLVGWTPYRSKVNTRMLFIPRTGLLSETP